jgi:hypothetical protein
MPPEACPDEISPAPRFYPVEYTDPQDFHPEAGYLCPSPSLRRKLRTGAMMALVGLATAASVTLAFAPRPAADNGGPDEAAVPALSASVPVEIATAAPAVAAKPDFAPKRETPATAARAQVNCDDFLASFLAAQCRGVVGSTAKARSARTARARAHRLATVAIGRVEPAPDLRGKAAAASAPSVGATTAIAADNAGVPKAAATEAAAGDTAAPAKPKPPVRTVHKERRPSEGARPDDATAMARGGNWGGYWGGNWGGGPRGGVRFGAADWPRSW